MRAILIDPAAKAITEVEHDDSANDIRELIQAQLFDVVRINSFGDGIYVDDEGLYNSSDYFRILGYPAPIAGKGLVLGTDHEGRSTEPMYESVESLEERITFITQEEAIKMAEEADAVAEERGKEAEANGIGFMHISAADIIKDRAYTDSSE